MFEYTVKVIVVNGGTSTQRIGRSVPIILHVVTWWGRARESGGRKSPVGSRGNASVGVLGIKSSRS